MVLDRQSALRIVKKVLMADFACEERHLEQEGVWFCEAGKLEGARRFRRPDDFLAVATMGTGTVISCSKGRLRWAKANLSKLSRDNIFATPAVARMNRYIARDNQFMAGPGLGYVCVEDRFQPADIPGDIDITFFDEKEIPALSRDKRFTNALGYGRYPEMPDVVAVLATYKGERVGMAGASADCDTMWQVGIDTLPGYRKLGIGKALVGAVTGAIFKKGILPYYMTGVANIASRRTAISLGYRPVWVELYSQEKKRDKDIAEDSHVQSRNL